MDGKPVKLPPEAIVAAEPAESEESDSILSSPVLWIVAGVVVVGGAVAIGLAASSGEDPYGGNTGFIGQPLTRR